MSARQAADELSEAAEKALEKVEKKPILQQILLGAGSGL